MTTDNGHDNIILINPISDIESKETINMEHIIEYKYTKNGKKTAYIFKRCPFGGRKLRISLKKAELLIASGNYEEGKLI